MPPEDIVLLGRIFRNTEQGLCFFPKRTTPETMKPNRRLMEASGTIEVAPGLFAHCYNGEEGAGCEFGAAVIICPGFDELRKQEVLLNARPHRRSPSLNISRFSGKAPASGTNVFGLWIPLSELEKPAGKVFALGLAIDAGSTPSINHCTRLDEISFPEYWKE